jgi:hypothetical protein
MVYLQIKGQTNFNKYIFLSRYRISGIVLPLLIKSLPANKASSQASSSFALNRFVKILNMANAAVNYVVFFYYSPLFLFFVALVNNI